MQAGGQSKPLLAIASIAKERVRRLSDGKGIAPSTAKGFGLTAMTGRVRSLGGSCVIESARSRGTTIHVEIPVKAEREKKAREPEWVGAL